MKIYVIFLSLILMPKDIYSSFDNDIGGIDVEMGLRDLTRVETNLSAESGNSQEIAEETGIRKNTVTKVHNLFSNDYERNVQDLLWARWFFRKTANISELLGNTLTYVGIGATTLATGTRLINEEHLSDMLLFTGTACFAVHLTFIGIARCSAREQEEREEQLKSLAKEVKFNVVPLTPVITSDANAQRS